MSLLPTSGRSGFTTFETFCVIIILLVLTAFFWPFRGGDPPEHAKKISIRATMDRLQSAILMFELHCGALPPSLQNLIVNPGVSGWKGPYVEDGKLPKDPWGNPYLYQNRGDRFLLFCSGPPGKKQAVVVVEKGLSNHDQKGQGGDSSPEPSF